MPAPKGFSPQIKNCGCGKAKLEVQITGPDGTPLTALAYELIDFDNKTRSGKLDDEGFIREEDLAFGPVVLSLDKPCGGGKDKQKWQQIKATELEYQASLLRPADAPLATPADTEHLKIKVGDLIHRSHDLRLAKDNKALMTSQQHDKAEQGIVMHALKDKEINRYLLELAPRPWLTMEFGVFFDGTGQNRENDIIKESHGDKSRTNIARLFEAYDATKTKIYVSGIGTLDDATPEDVKTADDEQSLVQADGLGGESGAYFKWQSLLFQLEQELSTKDEYFNADEVMIDVFGFSRGAALARHFVNSLAIGFPDYARPPSKKEVSKESFYPHLLAEHSDVDFKETRGFWFIDDTDKHLRYEALEHKKVGVRFLGLLDTVGSFYMAGNNDEGEFTLGLKPDVAQYVYQIAAAHEYRNNFPLTSIGGSGPLPENFKQDLLPGCHTDVGGGYPDETKYLGIDGKLNPQTRTPNPVEAAFNVRPLKQQTFALPAEKVRYMRHPQELAQAQLRYYMEQERIWQQEAKQHLEKTGRIAEVHRDGSTLYLFEKYPVPNALAAISLNRLKQQAESAGVVFDEAELEYQKDWPKYQGHLSQVEEAILSTPAGKVTENTWNVFTSSLEEFIHQSSRPDNWLDQQGIGANIGHYLVNRPDRNRQGQMERDIYANEN